MKISEFNKQNEGSIRIAALPPYKNTARYILQVWCPQLNRWTRHLPQMNLINFRGETEPQTDETRDVPEWVFRSLGVPCVIIDTDDHGSAYYSAMSTEEAAITFLKLLKERQEQVTYFGGDLPTEPRHKPEEFADDEDLRKACEAQWKAYENDRRWYLEAVQIRGDVEMALKNRDGYLAFVALQSLNGEGDRVTIQELSTVDIAELEEVNGTVGSSSANGD